jgi:hypothetical protein
MAQLTESSHRLITRDVDLVYSPDDESSGGKGYYLHRYAPQDETSQLFETEEEAIEAFKHDNVRWEA